MLKTDLFTAILLGKCFNSFWFFFFCCVCLLRLLCLIVWLLIVCLLFLFVLFPITSRFLFLYFPTRSRNIVVSRDICKIRDFGLTQATTPANEIYVEIGKDDEKRKIPLRLVNLCLFITCIHIQIHSHTHTHTHTHYLLFI